VRRAVLCIALAALALAAPARADAARLHLTGTRPVAVRGTGFHQGERVRVSIRRSSGRTLVRRATASRAGTFTLTFTHASPPCGSWTATAVGSLGSRAMMAGMKFPDCTVQ
jgi:hypothetical protein